MRVLTWHVHGAYLRALLHADHEFVVPVDADRSPHLAGLPDDGPPWPANVREVAVDEVARTAVDVVLFQHRRQWEDQAILSEAQRRGPRVFCEHDPPHGGPPTDERHPVDDPAVTLVHVTHYNALMWDVAPGVRTRVVPHGVPEPATRATLELDRGIGIVNHLTRRGRRLGADVWERAVEAGLPLDLVGMAAQDAPGGVGEVKPQDLESFSARYRFLFNPIRYTSLGLAVVEAMHLGLPVVALATTEHATAVVDGVTGYVSADEAELHERMRALVADPALARRLGDAGRERARERHGIERFAAAWTEVLEDAGRRG